MTPGLLLTVFGASVAGSLHCVGMCGPLMACAVAAPGQGGSQHRATLGPGFGAWARRSALERGATHSAYHVSRGVGYVVLGGVAGGVGALLDLTSVLAGAVPIAGVLAGVCLVLIALAGVKQAMGWRFGSRSSGSRPGLLRRGLLSLQRQALRLPPTLRAAVLGGLTPLLPCGWLYAFVLVAAGTGSWVAGALVMSAFWLGTLPALLAVGVGLQGTLAALRRRAPKATAWATAAAMVFIAFTLITGRLGIDPAQLAEASQHQATQRNHPGTMPDATDTPACCELMKVAAERNAASTP